MLAAMSELFAPPRAALAETAEPELGWSSFSHVRRLAIGVNAFALVFYCATVPLLVLKFGLDGYGAALFLLTGACSLGSLLSLGRKAPHKTLVNVTLLGNVLLSVLLTLGPSILLFKMIGRNGSIAELARFTVLFPLAIPPLSALYAQHRIRKNAALARPPAQ